MARGIVSPDDLKYRSDLDSDSYRGTKAELVASGVCRPDWFPKKLEHDIRYDPPRVKRTYPVADRKPEVLLTHRRDSAGCDYWIVRIGVSQAEHAKRVKLWELQCAERDRRTQAAREEREQLSQEADPVMRKLRERYPGMQLEARFGDAARTRFCVSFYAGLEDLKSHGLVSAAMTAEENSDKRHGDWAYQGKTETGDEFSLWRSYSAPGIWNLHFYRDTLPRERKLTGTDLKAARQALRGIMERSGLRPRWRAA